MTGSRSFGALVATCALLAAPVLLAPTAQAAKAPPRAAVSITEPRDDVGSGPADLVVSGKATLPPSHTVRLRVSTLASSVPLTVGSRGTWTTTLEDLVLGDTSICAEVYDDGGGYVTGDCVRYTVLPTPAAFTLTTPTDGARVLGDFTVGGGCEYGSYVHLTSDSGLESAAQCDFSTRTWEAPFRGVPEGTHTITATASAGPTTIATRTVSVTVVAVPPPVVDLVTPEDGTEVLVEQPFTMSGTTDPSGWITVVTDGQPGYQVQADDRGVWTVEYPLSTSGVHRVCARVLYAGQTVVEDCVTLTAVIDPASLSIDTPAQGTLTAQADVEVAGSCFPGTTVVVADGSSSATSDCSGQYAVTLTGLADGSRTLTATMYDGTTVVTSRSVSITVDTTAPAPPVITSPVPGTTLTSYPVVLTGTAEPGVTVGVETADLMPYATTTASASGTWSVTLQRDYFEAAGVLTGRRGTITVHARATDAAGNGLAPTSVTYSTRLR